MGSEENAQKLSNPSIGVLRLTEESIWNATAFFHHSNTHIGREGIWSLNCDTALSITAYVTLQRTSSAIESYYTPSILRYNNDWTYADIQKLCDKKVFEESFIDDKRWCSIVRKSMMKSLSEEQIRTLIEEVQIHSNSNDNYVESAQNETLESLQTVLLDKLDRQNTDCPISPNRELFSLLCTKQLPTKSIDDYSDVFCMLYGGEFSAIPAPCADVPNPERWESEAYRQSMVLEFLNSSPPLIWNSSPKVPVTYLLFEWDHGFRLTLEAYQSTWEAYGRLSGRGKYTKERDTDRIISPLWMYDWTKSTFNSLKETLRELDREIIEEDENFKRYMGSKLSLHYWIMQALHALAQCAIAEEEFNLAIQICKKIEKYAKRSPSVHVETLYNRIFCHMEIKERKDAFDIAKRALSKAYSYTAPFAHTCEFMSFHLDNEKKMFLRLGERIAIERLMKELQVKFPWDKFKPIDLTEPPAHKLCIDSGNTKKRPHEAHGPATAAEFVLKHHLDLLGPSWKGEAHQGKIIAALCFVLTAEAFEPNPKSELESFRFPCRWREVPLDFGTPQFIELRDYSIEKTLERIEETQAGDIGREVQRQYDLNKEKRFGRLFRDFALDDLSSLAEALAHNDALLPLVQFFLLEGTIRGIPDVWMWTEKNFKGVPDVKCVAVEEVSESLRDDQYAWAHMLHAIGIHMEVCFTEGKQDTVKEVKSELAKQKETPMKSEKRDDIETSNSSSTDLSCTSTESDSYDSYKGELYDSADEIQSDDSTSIQMF